jgi:hypothetical protein
MMDLNPTQIERQGEHLLKLRLFKSRDRLEALLQQAANKELDYADFLEQVLVEEVEAKTAKNVTMRTSIGTASSFASHSRICRRGPTVMLCEAWRIIFRICLRSAYAKHFAAFGGAQKSRK